MSVSQPSTLPLDAQAPADAIRSTVDALSPVVDVGGIYQGLPQGPKYNLRCGRSVQPVIRSQQPLSATH